MKPILLYCLFFIMSVSCYANAEAHTLVQDTAKHIRKKNKAPGLDIDRLKKLANQWKPSYDDCTFTNQYTIAQRLKRYPFSKAAKILAVSFHTLDYPDPVINIDGKNSDSLNREHNTQRNLGLHIIKDSLDYSNLIDAVTLNQTQINRLTNILFNTNYSKIGFNGIPGDACYEPRNAIIFLDKHGKVYDYLEICFACQHYSSKIDRLTIGKICTQKYEMLRKYFMQVGVKYGTKKNMHGD